MRTFYFPWLVLDFQYEECSQEQQMQFTFESVVSFRGHFDSCTCRVQMIDKHFDFLFLFLQKKACKCKREET